MSPSPRLSNRVLILLILIAGVALRLHRLDANSLWVDEIITSNLAQARLPTLLQIIRENDAHPPFFYIIASMAARLGHSDFVVRLPAAFAGILSIPMIFVLASRLYGRFPALLAALLLASSPFHVYYSQEARSYTWTILFQLASLYFLYGGVSGRGFRYFVGYLVVSIAGIYTHYFAFLALASQVLFVILAALMILKNRELADPRARLRARILPFVVAWIVCALAYGPWYSVMAAHLRLLINAGGQPQLASGMGPSLMGLLSGVGRGLTLGQPSLLVALGLTAMTGLVASVAARQWATIALLSLSFAMPFLTLGLFASASFFQPRYGFMLLAPVLLLAARGLAVPRAAVKVVAKGGRSSVASAALLLVVAALALPLGASAYRLQKEDWRGAAIYLAEHQRPGDIIIADGMFVGGGDARRVVQGLGYYLGNQASVITAEAGLVERLPPDVAARGTAWGVLWYEGRPADSTALAADFDFAEFKHVLVLGVKQRSGLTWDDSAAILEGMLRLQPLPDSHRDLHLALAELYDRSSLLDLADQHVAAAIASDSPDDTQAAALSSAFWTDRQLRAARQAREGGSLAQARAIYAAIIERNLDPATRFDVLMEWGIMERFGPNRAAALDLIRQALVLRPDDIEAHANLGAVLLAVDRPDESAGEFETVIGLAPDHFWAHYLGGLAYRQMGEPRDALERLREAVALAPGDDLQTKSLGAALAAAVELGDCAAARTLRDGYADSPALRDASIVGFLAGCR